MARKRNGWGGEGCLQNEYYLLYTNENNTHKHTHTQAGRQAERHTGLEDEGRMKDEGHHERGVWCWCWCWWFSETWKIDTAYDTVDDERNGKKKKKKKRKMKKKGSVKRMENWKN